MANEERSGFPEQAVPLLILVEPHGDLLAKREKTLIVKSEPFRSFTLLPIFIVERKHIVAKVVLANPEKITLEEFQELRPRHKISEAERDNWWPDAEELYAYEFQFLGAYDEPIEVAYPTGPQVVVRKYHFVDERPPGIEKSKSISARLESKGILHMVREIESLSKYDPGRIKDDAILRDDWRWLVTHWIRKYRGKKTSWTKSQMLTKGIELMKELVRREAIVLHPEGYSEGARDLYKRVKGELDARGILIPHALTEEELEAASSLFDDLKDEGLIALHRNLHYTWEDAELNKENVWNMHKLVSEELAERGLEHPKSQSKLHSELKEERTSIPLNPDRLPPLVLTHDALSFAGSACYEASGYEPTDRDFIVRSFTEFPLVREALNRFFGDDKNHVVYDALGANWDHVPLGDFTIWPKSLPFPDDLHLEGVDSEQDFSFLHGLPAFLVKEDYIGVSDSTIYLKGDFSGGVTLKLERIWHEVSIDLMSEVEWPDEVQPVGDLVFIPYKYTILERLAEPEFEQIALQYWQGSSPLSEVRQPFGSPGGKYKEAPLIASILPEHETYVEPFCGGCAVFFEREEPSENEVLNDIDSELIATLRFMKGASDDDIDRFQKRKWKLNEKRWERAKASKPKSLAGRAYRFLYVRLGSFGHGGKSFSPSKRDADYTIKMPKRVPKYRERLKGVKLLTKDWLEVCKRYDKASACIYIDPPYPGDRPGWDGTPDKGPTLEELKEGLGGLKKAKWILSLNGSPETKRAFEDYTIREIPLKTRAGRKGEMKSKADTDLLITNFDFRFPKGWKDLLRGSFVEGERKQKIEPLKPFTPMKALAAYHEAEYTSTDDLWEHWARGYIEADRPLAAEPKYDGVRMTLHRKGDKVAIFTEDKKRDRADYLPLTAEELRDLPCEEIILDAELVLYEDDAPIPRRDMIKLIVGKGELSEEEDLRVFVHDFIWLDGKDLSDEPYLERMKLLEKEIIPEPLDRLRVTEYKVVDSRKELEAALKWASNFPGSEGSMIRSADCKYDVTGARPRSIDMAKFRISFEIKVNVIGRAKKPLPWASIDKKAPKKPLTGEDALEAYRGLTKESDTYLYRGAIRSDSKLIPIETEQTQGPSELELRWVVPGKEDPFTGHMVSGERGKWKGISDHALWEMGEGLENREAGKIAYGTTYAANVEARIGDIITVAPVLMRKWKREGDVHYSWTFPTIRERDPTRTRPDTVEDVERIVKASRKKHGKLKTEIQRETAAWRLPPFSSVGGSYFIAPMISELLPGHHTYVEPFCGAASVLFSKRPSEAEVLNDLDEELIQALRDIRNLSLEELVSLKEKNWHPWKRRFDRLGEWRPKGKLDRLYRFLYLQWHSFNGNRVDYRGRPKNWNLRSRLERVNRARARLHDVHLTSEDGLDCISRWDSEETAFYIDPPFPGYGGFSDSDFEELLTVLRSVRGRCILRINDLPEHRELLDSFNIVAVSRARRASQVSPWDAGELMRTRAELLALNYPVPERFREEALETAELEVQEGLAEKEAIKDVEKQLPPEVEKTRKEQRKELEKVTGNYYLTKMPPDKTLPSSLQYHIRGIYSPDQLKTIRKELKSASNQEELDAVFKKWKDLTWAKASWKTIKEDAQKVDDERGDVTQAIHQYIENGPCPFKKLSKLYPRIGNVGNCHGDFRLPHPSMKYLSGSWTMDVVKSIFQTVEGDIVYFLRDRVMENKEGDQWLCHKKCKGWLDPDEDELLPWIMKREEIVSEAIALLESWHPGIVEELLREGTLLESIQPMVWLTIVTADRPVLDIPVGEIGATKATAGKFIWVAKTKMAYGTVSKSDFHPSWHRFQAHNRDLLGSVDYDNLDGRWDVKLIPSSKKYAKAPEEEFWMGMRPWTEGGQKPYVLTHDREEEEGKARGEGIEMIWNEEALKALKKLDFEFEKGKGSEKKKGAEEE